VEPTRPRPPTRLNWLRAVKTALARLRGWPQPVEVRVDPASRAIHLGSEALDETAQWEVPTTGTVYGVALNYRDTLSALGMAVNQPPYKAPPRAPVLYLKPRNTWSAHGTDVRLTSDVAQVALGPALGVVIGRTASRVRCADAYGVIAGYTVVNDLHIPHDSYYRPAIRQQCRDGYCPIGPVIVPRHSVAQPAMLTVRAYVNGVLELTASLQDLVRPVDVLIQDVTEFMTLAEGDVLMVGLPAGLPRARAGDRIAIEVPGVGRLENRLVAAP